MVINLIRTFLKITSLLVPYLSFAQDNCGCGAALRYDYYKQENNYFNELLLAREINQSNYKEVLQNAGGSLALFGIELEAKGENIEKIKQQYAERTRFENTVMEMSKYESVTTSQTSFLAFSECMRFCLEGKQKGLKIYKISESQKNISIDLYYLGEGQASPADVTYYVSSDENPKNNEDKSTK